MSSPATSVVQNLLERDYQPKTLQSLAMQKNALLAFLPKSTNGGGLNCAVRYWYAEAGGVGPTVATAQAEAVNATGGSKLATFDWKLVYSSMPVSNVDIALSTSGGLSIADWLPWKMKSKMEAHGQEIETHLFGGGNGMIGRVSSGYSSGNVITLTNPSDAHKFRVGMIIQTDNDIAGASPDSNTTFVTAVDKKATSATITVDDATDITTISANDYIFHTGFLNGVAPPGLSAHLPTTAPVVGGGDDFGGMDRSVAPVELAGWRFATDSGEEKIDGIIRALTYGSQFGNPEGLFVSFQDYGELLVGLNDKTVYNDKMTSDEFKVQIAGVRIAASSGTLIMPSIKCPVGTAYALTRNTWELRSVGPLIAQTFRNGSSLDSSTADEIEVRHRSIYELICKSPKDNGVITFT